MSETTPHCARFERRLTDPEARPDEAGQVERDGWAEHLETCESCSTQWETHQLLAATFESVPVADLSPGFDLKLASRLESTVAVRPLRGWRWAAMIGYAALALALLARLLRGIQVPAVALESGWLPILVMAFVPLSFVLALYGSRWLPTRRGDGGPTSFLALSL